MLRLASVLFSFLISMGLLQPVLAGPPLAELKFNNVKISKEQRKSINKSWAKFLKLNNSMLLGKQKDGSVAEYRVDQSCEFEFALNDKSELHIDSLKLSEHKNNFDYNLKAIEFLRENPLKLKKKKADKASSIKFLYFAF